MLRSTLIVAIAAPLMIQMANAQSADDVIVEDQASTEVRGDWVLGARVTTPGGEAIGSIEDLILDHEDGAVNAAIVSVGGFLGFGGKEIAVEWSELDINYDGNEITLDITRDEAEEAPEYVFRERRSPPVQMPETGTGTGMGTGGVGGGQ